MFFVDIFIGIDNARLSLTCTKREFLYVIHGFFEFFDRVRNCAPGPQPIGGYPIPNPHYYVMYITCGYNSDD